MRRALRYSVSVGVGLVATALGAEFATTDQLMLLSLAPLYAVVTSMLLAHRRQWIALSRGSLDWSARKRGAAIGGVGAFTGVLLLQTSVPAGIAGDGLLLLGMAGAVADFDEA